MFHVPGNILEKLTCSVCMGYLNRSPVVMRDGFQICARCYEILPQNEKEKCVRQLSYEAVGMCLVFPCRYHRNGCDYMASFDNQSDHELNCNKKHFTYPSSYKNQSDYTTLIDLKSTHSEPNLTSSSTTPKVPASNLVELSSNYDPPTLQQPPFQPVNYSISELNNNESSTDYEYIYDIPHYNTPKKVKKCLNCSAYMENKMTTCLYGHVLCKLCQRSDMCLACVKNLDGNSPVVCKNASRGCRKILQQGDAGHHRDSCEYNEIKCPAENCPTKNTMDKLVAHLQEHHPTGIILNSETSITMHNKDKTFIFLCYDGIFQCSYYYYDSYAEICAVYLGSCDKASQFAVEVSVTIDGKTIKRKMDCANWNNSMLDNSVTLSRNEISHERKKPSFLLDLKISKK